VRRILVGVDGSEPSLRATRLAAELASKTGAKLTLAYVILLPFYPPEAMYVPSVELDKAEQKLADEVLQRASDSVRGLVPEVGTLKLQGNVAESLVDAAQAEDIDMVVVGSRGRNAVTRVLLGSVADRVVHICKKPVLVVR